MRGKEKCKALKEIRRQIAEQNDIKYVVSECKHQGECRGTCPKCESELRYLERELAVRQSLGKAVAIAGITVGVCTTLTACNPIEVVSDIVDEVFYNGGALQGADEPLTGDVQMVDPDDYQGMETSSPENDEPDGEEILGGLEEYDPDEEESSSSDDIDVIAGDVEYIEE